MSDETIELPVRMQVDPVVGFKTVTLKLRSGSLELSGMRRAYKGVTEKATCSAYPKPDTEHEAPLLSCTCGFYAYNSLAPLEYGKRASITATVEMFGTVIAHEKGYRASHQRVTGLQVGRACDLCAAFGDERRVSDAFYFTVNGEAKRLCAEHGALSERLNASMKMSLTELAERLEVEVGWAS